jgi:hypothetical protein
MMAQTSLHGSARSELDAAVRSYSRALTAWRGVSRAGAPRAVNVANTLVSLREATYADAPESAPTMLGAVVDDAGEALQWLDDAIGKLARMLRGLETQSMSMLQRASSAGAEPLLATMSCTCWAKLLADAVSCLRQDLDDKERCVDLVKAMAQGLAVVDADALERGAETWLEMPHVDERTVDLIQAAYDAELAAAATLRLSDAIQGGESDLVSSMTSTPGTPSKGPVSPAMAFLLGSGKRAKPVK